MKIQTVISPSLFNQIESIEDKIVVVIDILRATSTITTIINNDAKALIAVKNESSALEYKSDNYLIGGERNGETIPGFDFGNSPFDYKKDLVRNKTVVLTTTNGTKCIEMSSNASEVIIGSFLNLTAVVNYVQEKGKDIVLFCAGWKDKVNLEDSLFAGAFALKMQNAIKDDSTLLCMKAYENRKEDLFETLKKSNHFNRLKNKGVVDDIKYCCNMDITDVVPKLNKGLIVK